ERGLAGWCARNEGPKLLQRLETIAILDPACGSGAFLLSALHAIEKRIEAITGKPADRQAIVERSLFGVDLKPEAVRLCELRLWLAIVSRREMPVEQIPPLPNLDRNILQGNSLLSPIDFLGDGRGDVYREWVAALRAQSELIGRYRSAPQGDRPALARMIRGNDQRLAAELLAKAIDIDERELQQIATPQKDLFGRVRPMNLARCRELHERIADSRRLLDRAEDGALALSAPAGVISLLMPAKVMNAAYAAPLRRAAESLSIVALDDWSDRARRLFDADTFPLGITIAKRKSKSVVRITANGEEHSVP